MPKVIMRPRAKTDLLDIWHYIADDNEERADSFVDRVEEKIKNIASNPLMGRSREELSDRLRSWPIKPYIVFYLPLSDGVEVVRVLHGSRDIDNILFEEGLS
jgi:toxin ParE1/3/4